MRYVTRYIKAKNTNQNIKMNKCHNCKAEIDENKSFCSNRCRQKGYPKRKKIRKEIKPLNIEPVREYSQEYKDQFAMYQNNKKSVQHFQNQITALKSKIDSIENRNYTVFGQKKIMVKSYGLSLVLAFITFKAISVTLESKRKGILFFVIFAPLIYAAYFFGQKLQNEGDADYLLPIKA